MSFDSVSQEQSNAFRDSIKHVVVLVLENRSFDSILGFLYPNNESLVTGNVHVRYPEGIDLHAARTNFPPFFGLNFPRAYNADGSVDPPRDPQPRPLQPGYMTSPFYCNMDSHGAKWNACMPVEIAETVSQVAKNNVLLFVLLIV
jgi:phospholipase C